MPGLLRATEAPDLVYRIRLASPNAKVEWSEGHASLVPSNWEVTVTVDRQACEVSCSYRLKRDGVRPVLAPPKVIVQVYTDGVSLPQTVDIDPGDLESPVAGRRASVTPNRLYMPARKLFGAALPQSQQGALSASFLSATLLVNRPARSPETPLPLRI